MSKVKTECECTKEEMAAQKTILTSEKKDCCKINISEINNTNTLEKNNNKIVQEDSFQTIVLILPVNIHTDFILTGNSITNTSLPVPDIPVINSAFLI